MKEQKEEFSPFPIIIGTSIITLLSFFNYTEAREAWVMGGNDIYMDYNVITHFVVYFIFFYIIIMCFRIFFAFFYLLDYVIYKIFRLK